MSTQSESPSYEGHVYSALMYDAILAALQANSWLSRVRAERDFATRGAYGATACTYARFAFFMACVAAESGANALLESAEGMSRSLYRDLEKLQTLNKYEVYCLANRTALDRSASTYGRMKSVLKLRNRFFHPKRVRVPSSPVGSSCGASRFVLDTSKEPVLDLLMPDQAIAMVADVLKFVAWVVFDLCHHSADDGRRLLSGEMHVLSDDLSQAQREFGFDLRSLGVPPGGSGA